MEAEMTSWKAKMYDAMRKIDKLGTGEKEQWLNLTPHAHHAAVVRSFRYALEQVGDFRWWSPKQAKRSMLTAGLSW
jgi:hypothetical protein